MIVIEIPHQSKASVKYWDPDAFVRECHRLVANADDPRDVETEQEVLELGWELWTHDLHNAYTFETTKEAKEWAGQYKGHQSITIKVLAEKLENND